MTPKPQQLDAMTTTIWNLRRLPAGERKQELVKTTMETLNACEARGEITASAKALMVKLLRGGLTPPNFTP